MPDDGPTILLVDDSQVVRTHGGILLVKLGYEVLTAEDGVQGLRIFKRHVSKIAAVVLDVEMPVMGGEETFTHIRTIAAVPVVISTAMRLEDLPRESGLRLADAFIAKPWARRTIGDVLARVLRKHDASN
jgi:two-component system cell cycle sensor histidine kinase/response regulator CckA